MLVLTSAVRGSRRVGRPSRCRIKRHHFGRLGGVTRRSSGNPSPIGHLSAPLLWATASSIVSNRSGRSLSTGAKNHDRPRHWWRTPRGVAAGRRKPTESTVNAGLIRWTSTRARVVGSGTTARPQAEDPRKDRCRSPRSSGWPLGPSSPIPRRGYRVPRRARCGESIRSAMARHARPPPRYVVHCFRVAVTTCVLPQHSK